MAATFPVIDSKWEYQTNWQLRSNAHTALRRGAVTSRVTVQMEEGDTIQLWADVAVDGKFNPHVRINQDGKIIKYRCGCGARDICVHVAVLIYFYSDRFLADDDSPCVSRDRRNGTLPYNRMYSRMDALQMDEAIRQQQLKEALLREQERLKAANASRAAAVLDNYSQELAVSTYFASENAEKGKATIVPVFDMDYMNSGICLSFQARLLDSEENEKSSEKQLPSGALPRAYVVKNIFDLAKSIKKGEDMVFSTKFSLPGSMDSFDEKSKALLEMAINVVRMPTEYRWRREYRDILMSNDILDQVFSLTENMWCKVDGEKEYRRLISRERPRLSMTITKNEAGEIILECPDYEKVYTGTRHSEKGYYDPGSIDHDPGSSCVYVYTDGLLRRYSPEESRKISLVLDAIIDCEGSLVFPPEKQKKLLSGLVQSIRRVMDVEDPENLAEPYVPDEMHGRILLDAPEEDSVAMELRYGYGDVWIDPQTGKPDSSEHIETNGLRRDIENEKVFSAKAAQAAGLTWEELSRYLSAKQPEQMKISGFDAVYQLLSDGISRLMQQGEVLTTSKFRKLKVEKPKKAVVGVSLDSNLLKINFDTDGLSMDDMLSLLKAHREKKKYYRLKNGDFVGVDTLPQDVLDSYTMMESLTQGLQIDKLQDEITVPAFRAVYLDGMLKDGGIRNPAFRKMINRLESGDTYTVPDSLENVLRPYQKAGFQWMKRLESCTFGGILADDMGLGKSAQLISVLLSDLKDMPSLIVSPSSLVLNWQREMEKFAPDMSVRIVRGNAENRKAQISAIAPGEVVLTSYDSLKRDIDLYSGIKFRCCAIDEAQFIKNQSTQASRAVKQIDSLQRFALTGTPIENRLSELWSIFDFLMPDYLFNYNRFRKQFETPITKDGDKVAKENLRRMIKPFVLRRLKGDVLTELPPKETTVLPVAMDDEQEKLYRSAMLTGLTALKSQEKRPEGVAKMQVLALLTRLRRICCDPSLCFDNYQGGSAKADACMELVSQAKDGGHKVLLFSQFTDVLSMLEKRLGQEGISFLRLQGSTPVKERMELVDRFNNGEADVFLISLKAGGTGLNLTAADTVILYDPWWNNAAQEQAADRSHRIGQKNSVQVYKLIMQNTIEERILEMQEKKKDLAQVVETDDWDEEASIAGKLTAEELTALMEMR